MSSSEADTDASSKNSAASENSVEVLRAGEILQLLTNTDQEASAPLPERASMALTRSLSRTDSLYKNLQSSYYGHPLSVSEAQKLVPSGGGGLEWYATIIPNHYFVDGKLRKTGLNKRDFDPETGQIMDRRPSLLVTATDFLSSLTKIPAKTNHHHPRYIFSGILNGWPCLRHLELLSIEHRRTKELDLPTFVDLLAGDMLWAKSWRATDGTDPKLQNRVYRAKLRGAPWTRVGWSNTSSGFCFWYEYTKKLSYGSAMARTVDPAPICTYVHMVSHRYAVATRETPRDLLTYHSVCVLEWDHGSYCTVAEAAYLNGIGGYKGKSNWFRDKDDELTALYRAFPPEMIGPWKDTQAEVRCYDVEARNFSEFKAYVLEYSKGPKRRFVDPQFSFSHPARLTFRNKSHIASYMRNYIMRDSRYAELRRNCQTFAADLCSFVAGKKDIAPFHPVSRIEYTNRTHLFLYEPELFA